MGCTEAFSQRLMFLLASVSWQVLSRNCCCWRYLCCRCHSFSPFKTFISYALKGGRGEVRKIGPIQPTHVIQSRRNSDNQLIIPLPDFLSPAPELARESCAPVMKLSLLAFILWKFLNRQAPPLVRQRPEERPREGGRKQLRLQVSGEAPMVIKLTDPNALRRAEAGKITWHEHTFATEVPPDRIARNLCVLPDVSPMPSRNECRSSTSTSAKKVLGRATRRQEDPLILRSRRTCQR
jgi:hypothetical protein